MKMHEILEYAKFQNERIKEKYNLEDDRTRILSQTVKLSEEVGELANEVLASQGLQRKQKLDKAKKENISKEMADVVFVIMILANNFDIDIEQALSEKIKTIKIRHE